MPEVVPPVHSPRAQELIEVGELLAHLLEPLCINHEERSLIFSGHKGKVRVKAEQNLVISKERSCAQLAKEDSSLDVE